MINKQKIPFQYVPVEKLNRITGKNHQGIITYISQISYHSIEQLIPSIFEKGDNPILLILDGVTDIRNFGAIARTALCAGVHAIIVPSRGSAQINSDAVKTSAGALLEIPVIRSDNLGNTISFLKESGLQVIGASEKAGKIYYNTDFTGPVAIIIGSEDKGIFKANIDLCDQLAKIPVEGNIGSLNVSVAAAILMYESVRQNKSNNTSKI